jgi:predicted regulator of Ras-like GTPase activity (Roadblock/LC7/MglB family)
MAKVDEVLREIKDHVDEALFTAIVNLEDGTPVAGEAYQEEFDIEVPVAFLSDVARRGMKAAKESGFGDLEDIVITTRDQFVLIRVLPGSQYVHLLSLGKGGNWGIAKVAMQRYAEKLKEALP